MDDRSEKNTPADGTALPSTPSSMTTSGKTWRERLPAEMEEADNSLCPAPRDLVAKGLTTAFVLCAPAGFTESERKLWLAVAVQTLDGIPPDLLQRGVREARLVADHPSKIIPAIIRAIGGEWDSRKARKEYLARLAATPEPPEPVEPTVEEERPLTEDEIRTMPPELRRVALKRGWLTQEQIDQIEESACEQTQQ